MFVVADNKFIIAEETVRIEARNSEKERFVKTLNETSFSIMNFMKDIINERTLESEIEELYKSVEEFICESEENRATPAFQQFYKELEEKMKYYAKLKYNTMKIMANFLRFNLKLKKTYGIEMQVSEGSLILKLMFFSERGYDLYMQDFKRGEIRMQILSVLLYPPYLANFDLDAEDLMIYLNDTEITKKISKYQ
jgi:hypothetical protein